MSLNLRQDKQRKKSALLNRNVTGIEDPTTVMGLGQSRSKPKAQTLKTPSAEGEMQKVKNTYADNAKQVAAWEQGWDEILDNVFQEDAPELVEAKKNLGISNTSKAMTEDAKKESVGKRLMGDISEVFGLTDFQAAGIVGNFDHETGGFNYLQEIKPVVPGSKGGRGFAMWTGPRRKAFESWSEENNLNPDSYEASFGFFVHEVQNTSEGRFMKKLQETETAEEAARIFSQGYLRPGKPMMERRVSKANYYAGEE
jgi:hypothetical protein